MLTAGLTSSRVTTMTAGVLVLTSAVAALWSYLTPTVLYDILRATAPVALLAGIVVLVVGLRGEKGLLRCSAAASIGLLVFTASDVLSLLVLSTTTAGAESDQRVLSVGLLALTLLGLTAGFVAVSAVLRRDLLERWSGRTLLAVVVIRAVFVVASFIPFADFQLLLAISRASVVVPLTLLAFGVALMFHGRGPQVRAGTRRLLDEWRSSTDVV